MQIINDRYEDKGFAMNSMEQTSKILWILNCLV